jgi:hypothetical protein
MKIFFLFYFLVNCFLINNIKNTDFEEEINAGIEIPQTNFLYCGIETFVNVWVPGKSLDSTFIIVSNATYRKLDHNSYIIKALKRPFCNVQIFCIENGDTLKVDETELVVKYLPAPDVKIGSQDVFPNSMSIEEIFKDGGSLIPFYKENFPFIVRFRMLKYDCQIYSKGSFKNIEVVNSYAFSKELHDEIVKLSSGDYLVFSNITVEGPDERKIILQEVKVFIGG